jgi:hypothetical protein
MCYTLENAERELLLFVMAPHDNAAALLRALGQIEICKYITQLSGRSPRGLGSVLRQTPLRFGLYIPAVEEPPWFVKTTSPNLPFGLVPSVAPNAGCQCGICHTMHL